MKDLQYKGHRSGPVRFACKLKCPIITRNQSRANLRQLSVRSTYDSHDLQDILQTRSPWIGFPAARFRETSTSRLQVLLSRPCPLNTSSHRDCAARFYAIPGAEFGDGLL